MSDTRINSALHLSAMYETQSHLIHSSNDDEGRLEDCIPCSVPDVHHFSRMVYSVRNSYFNLPNCMMYPKFKFILRELTRVTRIAQIMYLDPLLDVPDAERLSGLHALSREWLDWAANLTVCRLINTSESILRLPLAGETRVSVSNTFMNLHGDTKICLTFKEFNATQLSSESDRMYMQRLLAAEHDDVSPRAMLLLLDESIPLEVIPGFTLKDTVISYAAMMSH